MYHLTGEMRNAALQSDGFIATDNYWNAAASHRE
jgi:hypothetical protein